MNWSTKSYLLATAALFFAFVPARAAQVKALGMVLDSQGGQIGQSSATAGATIFAGDILFTDTEGDLKVRVGQTTYELLGDTSAAFYQGQSGPIAELRRGTMKVANNSTSEGFEIYASDVRVVSDQARPIQGEVSLKSPCELVVSSPVGVMHVVAGSEKRDVDHDHAYRVIPEHSVDSKRDVSISPEDPDYHRHHEHTACAVAIAQNSMKGPLTPANSRFTYLAVGAIGVATIPIIVKALESPDRP